MIECPYCGGQIGDQELYNHFVHVADYETSFDFTCGECENVIAVEVVPVPEFTLHKKESDNV